jgi:methionyl-tRNA synthetase
MREVPFGLDGDFSRKALTGRINNDLANDIGNLFSRILAMTKKYFDGTVPESGEAVSSLSEEAASAWREVTDSLDKIAPHLALTAIWSFIGSVNKFLDDEKPWILARDPDERGRLAHCMREGLEALRVTALLIAAFMPDTAQKMWSDLGLEGTPSLPGEDPGWWMLAPGKATGLSSPLFPRIEEKK